MWQWCIPSLCASKEQRHRNDYHANKVRYSQEKKEALLHRREGADGGGGTRESSYGEESKSSGTYPGSVSLYANNGTHGGSVHHALEARMDLFDNRERNTEVERRQREKEKRRAARRSVKGSTVVPTFEEI